MAIFIGGAWPYANGSLHLGHIASLLPGDILARYFRLKGKDVLYVSGSDCHGTPISVRACQENLSPRDITNRYHNEFVDCFNRLGFSYDLYTRTDHEFHHNVVKEVFSILFKNGYIYKKSIEQTFCETCNRFLPDRYVEGACPHCGNSARGDQCDFCSALLEPGDLLDKKCKLCGSPPSQRSTNHLFFALSRLQNQLESYAGQAKGWRENAVQLTNRYLSEGLPDRAATRDLEWGIDIPVKGFEGKKIYVWIDAVLGYLSASRQWAEQNKTDWKRFWGSEVTAYYVHGKDNIPFHTIILPGLLSGTGGLHLPDRIISSEYLTIEGKKLSTSRNWAVWVPDILERYNPDSFRYYLTINGPEKRDSDFSWNDFTNRHNGELLGAFGNFANRSLVFVHKYYQGKVPNSQITPYVQTQLVDLYTIAAQKIEAGEFKAVLDKIFAFIRSANKYFDERQPWIKVRENPEDCAETLYTCVQILGNLSNLLSPIIPFTSEKLRRTLNLGEASWKYIEIPPLYPLQEPEILFERIDRKAAEEELKRLGKE